MRDAPDRAALARLVDETGAGRVPEAVALARAVIAREAAAGAAPVDAWAVRLAALYGAAAESADALERRLAADIRAGACDHGARREAVHAHLIATVRAKLAELDPALEATWPLLARKDQPWGDRP